MSQLYDGVDNLRDRLQTWKNPREYEPTQGVVEGEILTDEAALSSSSEVSSTSLASSTIVNLGSHIPSQKDTPIHTKSNFNIESDVECAWFSELPFNLEDASEASEFGEATSSTSPGKVINGMKEGPIDLSVRQSLDEIDLRFMNAHRGNYSFVPKANFNLLSLLKAVIDAIKEKSCPAIQLLGFGITNKAYLLTFANGREVIARIPHGRIYMKSRLESEVGAMLYAKQKLPLKWSRLIPTVYAWNSDPNNDIGLPYVIIEKMEGTPLSIAGNSLTMKQRTSLAKQLAQFTCALRTIGSEFNKIGGVFFEKGEFHIGPLTRNWGNDRRQGPEMDTGPWSSTREFCLDQVHQRLREWQVYHYPRIDAYGDFKQVNVDTVFNFLCDLASLVPKIVPENRSSFSLVHTDLNSGNILIDTKNATLSGIVDWEAAGILPDGFALELPRCFQAPTVYSAFSPLETSQEEVRQRYIELTQLKHSFILERSGLEPGYSRRLKEYSDLYKFDECLLLDLFSLEFQDLTNWVLEKAKEN